MKIRHKRQAKELYQALLKREQTWSRSDLHPWACEFELLATEFDRERIQRVLDWYCTKGCGALFVPLIGTADNFRMKFEKIEEAMVRLDGQPLRYFDDVLKYRIRSRITGTAIQQECSRVMQRMQQRIQFVDDLAHGRVKLPKASRSGHHANGHHSNGKPSKPAKVELSKYVLASRDLLWTLIMQTPGYEAEFDQRLMSDKQLVNRLERYFAKAM